MGGRGSGTWFRYSKKKTVELCHALDVNNLHRHKSFRYGTRSTITWTTTYAGEESKASIAVHGAGDGVRLSYTTTHYDGDKHEYEYPVNVVQVPCNYGGSRPYFICPGVIHGVTCDRRVAKLYLPPGHEYFLCRSYHDLSYASCNESRDAHFTARRRTARVARKLGLEDPEDAYYIQRPKGMYEKTFDRLSLEFYIRQEEEYDALRALTLRLNEQLKDF